MSTLMIKNSSIKFTPVSNVFIDKYMPKARGEFIKVYLLLLKYNCTSEPGVTCDILASTLNLLESDVMNALNYWNDEGIIKLNKIDTMNNFSIEFLEFDFDGDNTNEVNLLHALGNNETSEMLKDTEKILNRPLSAREMEVYLSWQKDYNFSSELILLLIEYCASKGKSDFRYIEKIALAWNDLKIKTVDQAQEFIKLNEDKWIKIRRILKYLGIKTTDLMKPQEDLLDKWINTYKFNIEVILKACDICAQRLNRPDFKYIDGILTQWYKNNIKTLEDIALKDNNKKGTYQKAQFTTDNKPSSKFNNFKAREYDYDSLKKQLLGWDNDD